MPWVSGASFDRRSSGGEHTPDALSPAAPFALSPTLSPPAVPALPSSPALLAAPAAPPPSAAQPSLSEGDIAMHPLWLNFESAETEAW